jgi:hypothetical protein
MLTNVIVYFEGKCYKCNILEETDELVLSESV